MSRPTSWASTARGRAWRSRPGSSRRSGRSSAGPRSSSRSIRRRTASRSSGPGWRRRARRASQSFRRRPVPRSIGPAATRADEAPQPPGPRVEPRVRPRSVRELESEASGRNLDGADRTEGGTGLRIEPLHGLGEAAIPIRHDRAQQLLRSVRIGFAELLDRPVEVSEDPTHLLFEEAEAPSAELAHLSGGDRSKGFGREPIPRLEIPEMPRGRMWDELLDRPIWVDGPRGLLGRRDRDEMETLAFLVGQERHAECEEPQESVLDCVHVRTHPGLRTQAGVAERARDPFRAGDLVPGRIPQAPTSDDGDEALQEVAARGDQLGPELPAAFRVESQREIRGRFEIVLDRLGGLDPDERVARRHEGPEVGERFDDERLQGRGVAHAETASSAPPRTAWLTSFTFSYWARARTRESPRRRKADRRSSACRSTQMSITRSSNDRRSSRFPRIRSSSPTTSSNMWILRSRSSIRFASTVSSAQTLTTWTSRSWPRRWTRPIRCSIRSGFHGRS